MFSSFRMAITVTNAARSRKVVCNMSVHTTVFTPLRKV